MSLMVFTALSLSFAGGYPGEDYQTPPALPDLPAITRYVAPETGSDAENGLTPATAWRYPPGDSRATHGYTAVSGDHIAFRGGETYRGRYTAVTGVAYTGDQWGAGRCTHSGADPVTVRLPVSQADAGGHPDWASGQIYVAEWAPDGLPFRTTLFDRFGALALASARRNPEYWMRTDIDRHPGLTYDGLDGAEMGTLNRITDSSMAAACSGEEGRAQLWIRTNNNQYVQRTVTSVSGGVTAFEEVPWPSSGGTTFPPYIGSSQKVMLFNCVKHVVEPGDYATLSDGKAIFRSRGDLAVSRGVTDTVTSTRPGPNLSGRSNVTLRGFRFAHWVNRIVLTTFTNVTGWRIQGNLFEWCELWDNGTISLNSITGAAVSQNRFRFFIHDSNCIAFGGNANTAEWNVCHDINATAIQVFGDGAGHIVRRNLISNANGIHGNGISPYTGVTSLLVAFNVVWDCLRPLTTQGVPVGNSGRVFEDNILVANARGNGWAWWNNGTTAEDIVIRRNLCIGWGAGILIYQRALRAVINQNWGTNGTSGGRAGMPPGVCVSATGDDNRGTWSANDNAAIPLTYLEDVGAELTIDRVSVPRPDGSMIRMDLRSVAA